MNESADEPIEGEVVCAETDDAEYLALLARLDQEFPPVSGEGLDFSKITGNVAGRTAKAIVLHLSCTGWSIAEISDSIGVPSNIVGRYLAECICEASPLDDVEILRDFELRKLDAMERKCWEQFGRSCQDEVSEVTTWEIPDNDEDKSPPEKMEVTKRTRRGQSGNPAYMRVLADIGKRRAALVGMDKPSKVQIDRTEKKLIINQIVVNNRAEVEAAKAAGLLGLPGK